jgi:hypothetical protein
VPSFAGRALVRSSWKFSSPYKEELVWLRESTSPGVYFVALDRWLPRRRGGDGAFTSATVSAPIPG